ncbi:General substrate transporter [Niveomyces insectorum RCEF 264]|uniref:General substrate transporter n=1 Tax=Niveomyces insectorum RCEF 264 TaxID=1081102 RepID=A0A162JBV7_9HYPO|nr:General substrate transporter [Niveomyces insectorum RCEF 264]
MTFLNLRGAKLQAAQIWAVILPSYILFGYNNSVAGGLLNLPSWIETFPQLNTATTTGDTKNHNSTVQGTVVAMYTLGCFFGSVDCIWLGDRLGRKRTIMLAALTNIVGAILQSTSFSLAQLIVGRLVSGFGFGHLTATAPNWQAECSGAAHRGAAVMLEGLFISSGLAIGGWVNLGMSFHSGSVAWRFPLALSIVWSLLILMNTPFLPESPRWLIQKNRVEEARVVLADLNNTEPNAADVNQSVSEIQMSIELAGQAKFRHILKNGPLRLWHRTCLACAAQCFQQMGGINALAFYQTTIFGDDLGLPKTTSRIVAASVFTWQTVCSPIGVLTVDRFGRRKLMLFSAFGMGMCMAIVAGTSTQTNNKAAVGAAAAFIFLFSLFFPTGFLGLTFLYAAEISPLSYRVPITAMSTGTAWLFNFVVAEVTPNLAVYFLFPETNGRHLEEVDAIFLQSKNIFDTVAVAANMPKGSAARQIIEKAEANGAGLPEAAEVEAAGSQNIREQQPGEV